MAQALACRPLHQPDYHTNLYTGTNCMHCMRFGGLLGQCCDAPGAASWNCAQNLCQWTRPDQGKYPVGVAADESRVHRADHTYTLSAANNDDLTTVTQRCKLKPQLSGTESDTYLHHL